MKKQLLALAIAAALPMGAQAGVTIYGQANVSFDYVDDGNKGRGDVSSNSSRLGFKGSEKLSDSLKVFWKMEWHVSMSGDDAGRKRDLAQRNRYVGLKGGWGSVLLGRNDTPTKKIGRKVDLFYSVSMGDSREIVQADKLDARLDNVVQYDSPKFGGFSVSALWSANGKLGSTLGKTTIYNNADIIDVAATYSNGPFFAGASYGEVDNGPKYYRFTGSAKFGSFRVVGLFQNSDKYDRDAYGIGGSYTFGNNTIKGQYYAIDDRKNVSNSGADLIAVGLDHKFNKRTLIYAYYAQVGNDSNTTEFGFGKGGHDDVTTPFAAGDTVSGGSLGIRYHF